MSGSIRFVLVKECTERGLLQIRPPIKNKIYLDLKELRKGHTYKIVVFKNK